MLRRLLYHPEVNFALRQTLVLCLPIAIGWLFGDLQKGLLFSLVPSCCNLAGLDTPHKRFFKRLIIGGSLFAVCSVLLQLALLNNIPLPIFMLVLPLLLGVTGEISPLHARLLPGSLVAAVFTLSLMGRLPVWGPALLYIGGTLWYGVFNWLWFRATKAQQLRETISILYRALSDYGELKYQTISRPVDAAETLQKRLTLQQKVVDLITAGYQQLNMLPASSKNRQTSFLIRSFLMAQDIQEHISVTLHQNDDKIQRHPDPRISAVIDWNARLINQKLAHTADDILYHQLPRSFSMHSALSALEKLVQHYPENAAAQFCLYHFSRIARVLHNTKPLYQRSLMSDQQRRLPLIPAIRSYLSFRSTALRSAARYSVMLMFASSLALSLDMPKPYWILMTILFVSQNGFQATRVRIQHRALGTFAGLIIAALSLNFAVPESLILITMLLITFFSNIFNRQYYGWATIGFTVTAVYTLQLLSLNGQQFLLPRLVDTVLGCLIAAAGILWLWPQWQSALLRKNTLDVLEAFEKAVQMLLGPEQPAEVLESIRIDVNQKHNALFNSLNQAMQEPGFNSDYLQDCNLWVTHSQYIVEYINEMTALAREHTMLTPDLAERYLQSCEIAIQQCQQRLIYADQTYSSDNQTEVMDEEINFNLGPKTILERHLDRVIGHLKIMRDISATVWNQRPHHGVWLNLKQKKNH
jgi:YccS/YhfK family integral membrane protein